MRTNTQDLSRNGACSCAGSPTADDNRSLLSRLWRAVKAWERAMDDAGQDYVFDRLSTLEKEVSLLRTELESRSSSPVSSDRG